MNSRITRLLSAAVVLVVGVFALKRASRDSEVPVEPGTWEPV